MLNFLPAVLRRSPTTVGWSVRIDWTEPDPAFAPTNVHELVGFFRSQKWARMRAVDYDDWFASAPHRGRRLHRTSLVQLSRADFRLHADRQCRSPRCPQGTVQIVHGQI